MTHSKLHICRRKFLGTSVGTLGALATVSPALSSEPNPYRKIYLPTDAALPMKTAAAELADRTGGALVAQRHRGAIRDGEIVLVVGDDVSAYQEASAQLPDASAHEEWELVQSAAGGLLIAGSTPRNVCRAALGWVENPERETDRLSVFRFTERVTMWDNALNQMYCYSTGFSRRQHIREIARLGHTGIEINRYSYPGGYWVRNRRFSDDPYPWYLSYGPALDAFVESSLTSGLYPQEELDANLADLVSGVQIAREYGLEPAFVCYEPRCVNEKIFDRHPQLRGSRVDHPGRSLEPRYALDIANPVVLDHYAESLTNLMQAVPDLRYFVFWTQDSGSGLPFAKRLYAGPNGSYLARSKTLGQMASDFSGTLFDAGRKINPKFKVIMKMGWEYTAEERKEVIAELPKGVTVSHGFGGRAFNVGDLSVGENYIKDDRQVGIEPYAAVIVSTLFEQAPIVGVCAPRVLQEKIAALQKTQVDRFFSFGGILAPPQCPYNITQELYAELIRGDVQDLDAFLLGMATHWCEGDATSAKLLVRAWQIGEQGVRAWPILNWYHGGPGQTQGRWLTRPIVPDITLLNKKELAPWEDELFTLSWDIGRSNIAFEGGIRMYTEKQLDDAVHAYDTKALPLVEQAVSLLDEAMKQGAMNQASKPVLQDQRDRYQGLLLKFRTVRNLFDSQVAINYFLLKQGEPEIQRQRLQQSILAEIANTQDWLHLLRESSTYFFRVAEEETPFLHKTPAEDMEVKLLAMQAHKDDAPGPFLEELNDKSSDRNLLYYK